MKKHLLLAGAAGAGLMAASIGVDAASFSQPGVWANTVSPNYFGALVPSGPTSSDSTLLLEANVVSTGLAFSYVIPMASNAIGANVGGTSDSASGYFSAWGQTFGASIPMFFTTATGGASNFFALQSTSAFQAFSHQTTVPITGTATTNSTNRITCDVVFQAHMDAGNLMAFKVLAARPVNWASTGVAALHFTAVGAATSATTGFTISSNHVNGGMTGNASGATALAASATSSFTAGLTQFKTIPTFPTATSVSSYSSAFSNFTTPTLNSLDKVINALYACTNYAVTRNALTGAGLTKVW